MTNIENTLNQMMEDREYEPVDDTSYTSGKIFMSRNGDGTILVKNANREDRKGLGTEDVHDFIRVLELAETLRGIIVANGVSSQANDLITMNNQSSSGIRVEYFNVDRLRYNPTRTVFYNPHTLVTGEDLEEVRRVYSNKGDTSLQNLPKLIAAECPIVQYFGWSVGDLIRITRIPKTFNGFTPRNSPTIVYRLVV